MKGLNRKQRNKMAVVKEGLEVHEVMMQEGVPTFETVNDAVAEPVVYMIDRFVVGGFYRVHTERGQDQNLNAPGMHFEPLAFATPCSSPDPDATPAPAQPLLRLRRRRAPGAAGGGGGAGADGSRTRPAGAAAHRRVLTRRARSPASRALP